MLLRSLRIVIAIAISISALSLLLTGCASSEVTRDVSSGIDMGVRNSDNLINGAADGDIADSYQNSSQQAKGAAIGGIVGGLAGATMSSGVGIAAGTAIGVVIGASYGKYIDSNTTLEDRLENRGVNVIILGDQILIVIPSARIFYDNSSQIKPSAFSTLNLVTCFINRYTKMAVKIAAYTADLGSPCVTQALSKQQAEKVMRYLSAAGVDARLLYAIGADGSHLVVSNSKVWDSDNYRIEITLEKLYV